MLPIWILGTLIFNNPLFYMVRLAGFEPATYGLEV